MISRNNNGKCIYSMNTSGLILHTINNKRLWAELIQTVAMPLGKRPWY